MCRARRRSRQGSISQRKRDAQVRGSETGAWRVPQYRVTDEEDIPAKPACHDKMALFTPPQKCAVARRPEQRPVQGMPTYGGRGGGGGTAWRWPCGCATWYGWHRGASLWGPLSAMLWPAGARWGASIHPPPRWAQQSSWLAPSGGAACLRGGRGPRGQRMQGGSGKVHLACGEVEPHPGPVLARVLFGRICRWGLGAVSCVAGGHCPHLGLGLEPDPGPGATTDHNGTPSLVGSSRRCKSAVLSGLGGVAGYAGCAGGVLTKGGGDLCQECPCPGHKPPLPPRGRAWACREGTARLVLQRC